MSFKAICTDIDGTLLDRRRELSDITIGAFNDLAGRIPVILASSRMPSAMTHLQEQLGVLHHPLICYNGGYVIHFKNGSDHPEVLHSVFIPVDVCEGIIALTEGTSVHVSLYHEDSWYAPQWDSWAEREATVTKVDPVIRPLPDVLRSWRHDNIGAHKVMCMGSEQEISVLGKQLQQAFSNDIHIYRSRSTYLELAPRAISKGTALQLLLEKKFPFSIGEVIAFGDNYNDVDLLKLAGKGVAVANAREEVKAVADEVTLDSKENGVAVALQKHFLKEG